VVGGNVEGSLMTMAATGVSADIANESIGEGDYYGTTMDYGETKVRLQRSDKDVGIEVQSKPLVRASEIGADY
jgi:hypothetical protein